MIKPIGRAELVARVMALGRGSSGAGAKTGRLDSPPYTIDAGRGILLLNNARVDLTRKEFELARFLFQNEGRIVSRAHILESVWGRTASVNTRAIDTHASRIRTKLNLADNGWRLMSAYQLGYRLEPVPGKI